MFFFDPDKAAKAGDFVLIRMNLALAIALLLIVVLGAIACLAGILLHWRAAANTGQSKI
ncbi:MAG: hypothetical protein K8S99_02025 [Planctomycetes bacterium]|nr:hypothetical protein [Planctomycetota bacterium]